MAQARLVFLEFNLVEWNIFIQLISSLGKPVELSLCAGYVIHTGRAAKIIDDL